MLLAVVAVPWMLFPKPFILKRLHTEVFSVLCFCSFPSNCFSYLFCLIYSGKGWKIFHFEPAAFCFHLCFENISHSFHCYRLSSPPFHWCGCTCIPFFPQNWNSVCFISESCQFKVLSQTCLPHNSSQLRQAEDCRYICICLTSSILFWSGVYDWIL